MARLKTGFRILTVFKVVLFGVCGFASGNDVRMGRPQMSNSPLFDMPTSRSEFPNYQRNIPVDLPDQVSFFGSFYKKIFISPDGFIGFAEGIQYHDTVWREGVRNPSTDLPFMAPFYYRAFRSVNVDVARYRGRIYYSTILRKDHPNPSSNDKERYLLEYLSYYIPQAIVNAPADFQADTVVMVTWQNVSAEPNGTYKSATREADWCTDVAPCEAATFQAVLVHDNKNQRTAVIFNYKRMDIQSADEVKYFQSGFNGGFGRGWYNVIPCHCDCRFNMRQANVNQLPQILGSDLMGRFVLDVGGEIVVRGGCLPDNLRAGMLEVFPTKVGMFGGEKLEVSGHCMRASVKFYCKFGNDADAPVSEGVMINAMKGFCEVPMLTQVGPLNVYWSRDGQDWTTMNREINVVFPSRMTPPVDVDQQVSSEWFGRESTKITVPWDPAKFCDLSSATVEINLIGYREIEGLGKVEFKVLEKLGEARNNDGSYQFEVESHKCKENCKDFELGFLEVRLSPNYLGSAKERVAIRHGVMPIGWYVNSALTESMGSDWSDQMCQTWYDDDSEEEKWIEELLPCPCNLDQALADFGRWQPDPGCNLFAGSKCHYHIGAKHCVRSVIPTSDGSGNQCCYNQDGTLRYSQLSYQGSTPDRSHTWGAPPYNRPNLVPSLSHWKHDVVSFYYCCLWNEYKMCDLYMMQRSTRDCKNYVAPGLAFLRGDPHITTFDGQTYHFGGYRDYTLVKTKDLEIQGRFEPREHSWDIGTKSGGNPWKPSALTSVAILAQGQIIEIHPAPESAIIKRGLDIRLGLKGDRKFFLTPSTLWQDFPGQSIVNNILSPGDPNNHNNFTILTEKNVGINVFSANGLLHVTVALPADMKMSSEDKNGMGLFGKYDDDAANDFTSKGGVITSPGADRRLLFDDFSSTWGVMEEKDSIFPYHQAPGVARPKYFVYDDIPRGFDGSPTLSQISSICATDTVCMWDYRITGDVEVARTSRQTDDTFRFIQSAVGLEVENCGLPGIGMNAELSSYNFSVGRTVTVLGCDETHTFQGEETFECKKERVEEAEAADRADYGEKRTASDGTEYIVHWVPKPYIICVGEEADSSGGFPLEAIIGIVIGVIVLLIIIVVIIVLLMRRRSHRGRSVEITELKHGSTKQSGQAVA